MYLLGYKTGFVLPISAKSSRSILSDGSRIMGLFCMRKIDLTDITTNNTRLGYNLGSSGKTQKHPEHFAAKNIVTGKHLHT